MSKRKVRHLQAYRNRWGPGRVHALLYREDAFGIRAWSAACVKPRSFGHGIHGFEVPADIPITCVRCLNALKKEGIKP